MNTYSTYRYEKVEFKSDIERAKAFIDGDLFVFTHDEVVGDLEKDTHPVISLNQMLFGNAFYRRIEVTERELFIERCEDIKKAVGDAPKVYFGMIYDELVNGKG